MSGRTTRVYCRNNPRLRDCGVAFHWWEAEYTSLHDHDHYEFFIISSGRTNHILNGERRELSAGTLTFIHPEDCHQFTPAAGSKCIHINLAATKEKLKQLCSALDRQISCLPDSRQSTVTLSPAELSHFELCADELSRLQGLNVDAQPIIVMLICHMLLYAIVLLSVRQSSLEEGIPDWLSQLLQRIHKPENLSCHAADIYRMAGYSPPTVIRTFRRYTGQTVASYLTRYKMETACEMLLATQQRVLDIAGILGYSSVSHFNKQFREIVGMTPGAFRGKCRQETPASTES